MPNVLTYQRVTETATAGYLIRQWVASNLYDRIATRPFLTTIEKKWITYQLLSAMKEARKRKVPHGDLKSENVLVTSSLSVYVTDFAASFKPAFLPLNDPSDFNYFYDTSGRRTCYVAPERFYSDDSAAAKQRQKAKQVFTGQHQTPLVDLAAEVLGQKSHGKVTEAMDVFSLGCVIAELWRDGAPIFTLTQLFKYRAGQFDIEGPLAEISDEGIRDMVRTMISLDPESRLTFDDHLERAKGAIFPPCFSSFLHRYLITLQRTSSPRTTSSVSNSAASTSTVDTQTGSSSAPSEAGAGIASADALHLLRTEADERIERLYEEWAVVSRVLQGQKDALELETADGAGQSSSSAATMQNVIPVQLCIPGISSQALSEPHEAIDEDGPALLILSPLLANLRNVSRPSTKLRAFDLVLHISSRWLTDEAKLDRVLPYIISMLDDDSETVRAAAVRTCTQLLALVDVITPSNAITFSEYIMPTLRRLAKDTSSIVRAMYASCMVTLIRTGHRFLQTTSAMRAEGLFAADAVQQEGIADADDFFGGNYPEEANYDLQLQRLAAFFQEQVASLLTDASVAVKRNLLDEIAPICSFFGSSPTNDVVLSHMITYLNDRSWLLRQAFFDAIVSVARVAGPRSVEMYVFTLILPALSDPEEFVVLRVLRCLVELLGENLLSKAKVFDIVGAVAGFLCHPDHWLRSASALVVATAVEQLPITDVWAVVYPSIRPLLRADIHRIDTLSLLQFAKSPLSRPVMEGAVQWAARVNTTGFWKPPIDAKGRAGLSNGLGAEGVGLLAGRKGRAVSRTVIQRSEEDDGYLDKLRMLGLGADDEIKLVGLRDYLAKLAKQSSSLSRSSAVQASPTTLPEDSTLPRLQIRSALAEQKLDGVMPLTIFFGPARTSKNSTPAATVRAGPDGASLSMRSQAADSSFSGRVARRRLAGSRVASDVASLGPLEELRRRMVDPGQEHLEMPSTPGAIVDGQDANQHRLLQHEHHQRPGSPPNAGTGSGQATRIGVGKALPAIAANPTTVTGTMSELSARLRAVEGADASGTATPLGSVLRGGGGGEAKDDATPDGGPTFSSTYEGNDPYIRAHLEAHYLANFRDRHPGWGPQIHASGRRRGTTRTVTAGARAVAPGTSNRRPEGKLVAYFTEHTGAISALAVSPDHAFFVSGSEDGSLKVWDTARLEKNVTSRSRASYANQTGAITALIMLEGSHCVASASEDGSVHVVRVDLSLHHGTSSMPRYGKLRLVSNFQLSNPGEYVTCLLQASSKPGISTAEAAASSSNPSGGAGGAGSPTLILGTTRSRLTILDLRTMQVLQTLRNPVQFGPITAMCCNRGNLWLLVGTLGGVMALWDLRFGLLVKSWRIGQAKDGSIVRVNAVRPHPSKGRGRWVMIAYELVEALASSPQEKRKRATDSQILVETWDIEEEVRVESFECSNGRPSKMAPIPAPIKEEQQKSGLGDAAQAIERLVRLRELALDEKQEQQRSNERVEQEEEKEVSLSSLSCGVKAMLIGLEGYSSSSSTPVASGPIAGSWLDAGKLAHEEGGEGGALRRKEGYMICAGQDRRIRFWDLGRPDRSVCLGLGLEKGEFVSVRPQRTTTEAGDTARQHHGKSQQSGDDREGDPNSRAEVAAAPTRNVHCIPSSGSGLPHGASVIKSPLLSQQQASASIKAHRDAITALAIIESPYRCIVAGDRAGTIRVWE